MITLDQGFSFAIEQYEKRARLIVYKDGVENVCRRETFKNIEHFIRSDEERMFKGRLQLHKNSGAIVVEVKGKIAGTIKTDDFASCLGKLKTHPTH